VIQFGHSLGFVQQAGSASRAETRVAQHLNGYITVQQGIVSAIHDAHAAVPELGIEAIAVLKGVADHEGIS
jgi:hypothetical protein